jgi:glycerophosphoryl diester phosphodiesterase
VHHLFSRYADPSSSSLLAPLRAVICHDAPVTLVIAHRGASAAEPENTVAAFERAVALGADGIELDVRRTADDRLVIQHDARLPDGRVVRETRSAELPDGVPDLDTALDACAGAFVNIEIKNDPNEPDHDSGDWVAYRLAAALAGRGGGPRWLISSFRLETVDRCRVIAPAVRTAWLTIGLDATVIATALAHGHSIVHPWVGRLAHRDLADAHAAGLAVNAWTCDDPARIAELIEWGVDGICTNVPDVALQVRRRSAR